MTIAKRLILLLAVPLTALLAFGFFTRLQLARIERSGRFVAETQVRSLAALGNISRAFAEMRVNLRSSLLATNAAQFSRARASFDEDDADRTRLLAHYAEQLVTGERDRRLLTDFRELSREWTTAARQAMALAESGQSREAIGLLQSGVLAELGVKLSATSREWIQLNENLAEEAGKESIAAIEESRTRMLVANTGALLLTALLGFLTFRRIVTPIQALDSAVRCIAAGDYAKPVPYVAATDETGGLARSVDVLKEGAAAMEQQRWVKTSVAQLTGPLQGAASLAEFGQRLVTGLVPMLGGGVAGFYVQEEGGGRLRRIADYGLAEGSAARETFGPGEGLVGQCARDRRPVILDRLPPDYLRVTSGLGGGAPGFVAAFPVQSPDALLGVLEVASFRTFAGRENELLGELLPVVALSLAILQRNLRTHELLVQTQEQARLLEEQTEELTQSQEELITQKEELLAQQEELKVQREQLEISEERSRLILESSAEGIFGTDTAGRITFVNPAACQMLGFTGEELLGQQSHDVFHHHRPDGSEYPKEECPMYAAYTRGVASRIDHEFLWRKDGAGLAVEYGATPIVKDGVVVGSVVSFTDITERKRAEIELQQRAKELRQVNLLADGALELTQSGYWHVPLDGSGWYNSSERAARIFGDPPTADHRYTLAHWAEHVRLGDEAAAKVTMENFNAAVAGTVPVYDAVYAYRRPVDGRVVWIHALGRVVKDAGGKPTDMFGVTQDITEFKRLELDLVDARQRAEEATQMKSMFLANMSHEIRTPMNAIIGLSHLALKTALTPKQRDYVSKVHNAGTSLLAIINDILDFSKIEAGKLDIETTDFQLDEVIGSVTTVTAQKAHEKGLEFLADIARDIPESLRGDPLRLGQILTNLVNNAVKFTERGEIRLRIEALERTGEKVQLRFSVRDTGIGMSREQAARLFQPFSQADMSTTRKHGGTGLGLTICRRLVELMGGQIWLESEPGVGSTFAFTVWFGVGQASSGRVVPSQFRHLRALVVDDNAAAREILVESLEPLAERVDAVSSGQEALAAVRERDGDTPYDVVFMDWRMPGMDGLQATRQIKNDATLRRQPAVIIVTAFGREEVREEAEQLHVDAFLVKPVTKSMIVDSLVGLFAAPGGEAVTEAADDSERLRGLRVLLTEDNEINQQIAVELLTGVGAQVDVANNGREAVDRLFGGPIPPPYDIVLMDLQMPELDGYQATARIRADARFASLPIVAMTAHATTEERERCLGAGMNDHLSKPIDPARLFETVGRFRKAPVPGPAPAASGQPASAVPADAANPSTPSASPAPAPVAATAAPERGASRAVVAPELPVVEGLDTADGLTRVAGNRKLYLKLLRDFVTQQGPAAGRIAEALARGDVATAERDAHTVKGVAGSLGMRGVQEVAARLEKTIAGRKPPAECEPVLSVLRSVLGEFVNRLGAALGLPPVVAVASAAASAGPANPPAAAPNAPAVAVDPEASRRAVEQMTALLDQFDPAAGECLEANREVLRALLGDEAWTAFEGEVGSFAFAEALARLRATAGERLGTAQ